MKFNAGKEIKTTLIVTYKKGIETAAFKEAKKGFKFKKEEKLKFTEQDVLVFDTEEDAAAVKAKLEKRKNVESVEFDKKGEGQPFSLTNEPFASSYNYHMKPNPYIPNDNFDWLKLKQINDNMGTKPDVVLAIIDDGIKTDHPDFAGKFVDGYSGHQDLRQSQGGVVYIPNQTHGTMVAGMAIAKTNNGTGGSSIGGIFDNVKVLPISVYDPTGTDVFVSSFVRGINHAISRGVAAINLSWGNFSIFALPAAFSSAYDAGIACFVASGNDNQDLTINPSFPANYDAAIAVGSVDQNMTLSVWSATQASNYGKNKFVGNGGNIIRLDHSNSANGSPSGGTSAASPHVAGIYMAMKAVKPTATRDELIPLMKDTAQDLGNPHKFGFGYPNAVSAIRVTRILDGSFTALPVTYVPANKVWTFTMSGQVNASKLGGVYVLKVASTGANSVGREHPVNISVSGNTITVTPTANYVSGGIYTLVLSDVYNTNGTKMTNQLQSFVVI